MRYLIIALSFMFMSCTPFSKGAEEKIGKLKSKDNYLSFVISRDKNKITLHLKNISAEEIFISYPNCFGININPHMEDSHGNKLQIMFRVRAFCDKENVRLLPSESFDDEFDYTLDECFDFSKAGTYFLRFEYVGTVHNSAGEKISPEEPLSSNILEIKVN